MTEFGGAHLLGWARRAVARLEAAREDINALNVFPVPDSDTGSNMTATMSAALAAAEEHPTGTFAEIAAALTAGAVRGARGNSGIVLSQVLRALAETSAEGLTGASLARALETAVHLVDESIAEPVEGTVITVMRSAAIATRDATDALLDVVTAALDAARVALERTPSQLAALRQAGVVDAGGSGFVILLETLLEELGGDAAAAPRSDVEDSTAVAYLEVMFNARGDLDELAAALGPLGDSLVIARENAHSGRVHIHSVDAGRVIETAMSLVELSGLRLEVLPVPEQEARRVVVAVVPAGALADLFAQAGARIVSPGPDAVADIIASSRDAAEVIVVTNGVLSRREVESTQRVGRSFGCTVHPVLTSSFVEGIAALAVYDPRPSGAGAAYAMAETAAGVRTTRVHQDAASFRVETGRRRRPGGVFATATEAVVAACRDSDELVTILVSPDVALDVAALHACIADDAAQRSVDAPPVEIMTYPAQGLGYAFEIGQE